MTCWCKSKKSEMRIKKLWQMICLSAAVILSGGCAQFSYYVQAAQGQMDIVAQAKPIDALLTNPETDQSLKSRLRQVQEIRRFAVRELGLPENGSYKKYADLKRHYVMWNIVASPEFAIQPKQWCFPIAGCVNYRGYYSKNAAYSFAEHMQQQGWDIAVVGVPAYSTLGWFDDPVLSTFIEYSDPELARLIFHELAHQVVYIPGDTQFNESFATAVEEMGVERWLSVNGSTAERDRYIAHRKRREEFLLLLSEYREKLEKIFSDSGPDSVKRKNKAEIFASLKTAYALLKHERWNDDASYDAWFNQPLSNAHLALISTYHDLTPAFHHLWLEHKTFPGFYQSVRRLAKQDKQTRLSRLANLLAAIPVSVRGDRPDTTAAPQ